MSTSPQAQASGQRAIYVHLDQEPEVTQEVRVGIICVSKHGLRLFVKGFAIGRVVLFSEGFLPSPYLLRSSRLSLLRRIVKSGPARERAGGTRRWLLTWWHG